MADQLHNGELRNTVGRAQGNEGVTERVEAHPAHRIFALARNICILGFDFTGLFQEALKFARQKRRIVQVGFALFGEQVFPRAILTQLP